MDEEIWSVIEKLPQLHPKALFEKKAG